MVCVFKVKSMDVAPDWVGLCWLGLLYDLPFILEFPDRNFVFDKLIGRKLMCGHTIKQAAIRSSALPGGVVNE